MNQFIQRVANYVANEVIIKGLANSRAFQRFAVRTDRTLRDIQKTSTDTINSTIDDALSKNQQQSRSYASSSSSTNAGIPKMPKKPLTGISGFMSAFVKEIQKDLGFGGGEGGGGGRGSARQ